jgi:hypothetical protein
VVKPVTFIIFIISLGISFSSKSQNTFIPQWQAWFRYYNQTQLNEKFVLHVELDERRRLNPWSQSQFFAHLHLHYRVKPWLDVAAGMNYNLTNSTVNPSLEIAEWRPWQEASIFKKLGKDVQFQFRYRLDERFIHRNDKQVLMDGYHFNWRHRFRIQFSKPIAKFSEDRTLLLKLSDEVMLNSGDVARVFDQNRLSTSLEFKINNHWSIESGYLNLIQQLTDNTFSERHVIRTTLYHRIGFK